MAIEIEELVWTNSNGEEVKFNWTADNKSAVCSCKNKWTPKNHNDYKCKNCNEAKS